jgi:hypothetical protein
VFKRLFNRESSLAPPNVERAWTDSSVWRTWEPPFGLVVGESHYMSALTGLAGPPRERGYLIPVAVDIVRERDNRFDGNAFRVEVGGQQVGHLARHIAAQLAKPLDRAGCQRFTVCGVIRGGSERAPNLGVHVWFDRRLSEGPEIYVRDDSAAIKNWPPRDDEGLY